ncbi:MAG TPA: homoserine dehydrogenase [Lysobacter sp.]
MNAVAASLAPRLPHVGEASGRTSPSAQAATSPARVALLGTGTVGGAVLVRLAGWAGTSFARSLSLVHVANSRVAIADVEGLCPDQARVILGAVPSPDVAIALRDAPRVVRPVLPRPAQIEAVTDALGTHGERIVIDATASELVAERHAHWLAQGIHVVTACKLGQGTSLARWHAIRAASAHGGAHYGDSATVGAGLPLLRSIRELQAGGDRIHAIAGVLSGSLAWLFNHYDGLRPFSGFVREAREAGYTEPDPRDDLSGEDVRRKIVILARAAGVELDAGDVEVDSLVPPALVALAKGEVDAALPALDAPLRERYAAAWKSGEKLRFIARLENGRAKVGLESLPECHPLAGGAGTDNRVAIWSDRYRQQPLVIQGPGAGAEVTAAGLLDDVLRIVR